MSIHTLIYGFIFYTSVAVVPASTIVGVTGNSGNGNFSDNSFYEIDVDTGATTLKGSASVTPNQLAYDVTTDNYYYMDHTGSDFYRFDLDTGTEYFIKDLTEVGMPVGKTGSGGGDFYDGRYYYTPEAGSQSIFIISFNSNGSQIQSHTPITPSNLSDFSDLSDGSAYAGLGDFGDVAINAANGKMYGTSTMHDNGANYTAFWSIDLTTINYTMTMISSSISSVYQLAFDEANQLWGNLWANGAGQTRGEIVQLDIATGEVVASSTETLTTGNSNSNGDFYDLASTNVREGVAIIPEPSCFSLLILCNLFCFQRRRST